MWVYIHWSWTDLVGAVYEPSCVDVALLLADVVRKQHHSRQHADRHEEDQARHVQQDSAATKRKSVASGDHFAASNLV